MLVGIGGIFAPGLPDVLEILLQLAAAHAKQRPHDLARNFPVVILHQNPRMNPAQPPQPRPANHPHEHSLSLIIERVPGDDLVQTSRARMNRRFRAAIQRSRLVEERPFCGREKASRRESGFSP